MGGVIYALMVSRITSEEGKKGEKKKKKKKKKKLNKTLLSRTELV